MIAKSLPPTKNRATRKKGKELTNFERKVVKVATTCTPQRTSITVSVKRARLLR